MRARLALALSFTALIAALVGALGPAEHVRTTYSWPPAQLPSVTPSGVWYTPLLLIRREAETISARIPCALPRALPDAERPLTILATARFPKRNGGLAVTRDGPELVIAVGDRVLARMRVAAGSSRAECTYRLQLGDGEWSLDSAFGPVEERGLLETRPMVSGLFTAVDLRSGRRPSIDVVTTVNAARTTTRQRVAWTVAGLGAVAALLLVGLARRPRPLQTIASAIRGAAAHAHAADAAVGALLVGWWLLAPTAYDDGWIQTRLQNFSFSGGFSGYFNVFGANQPLGYWIEWAQHWLSEGTSVLLFLRLPALVCLAATWALCRWLLARATFPIGKDALAPWILAIAFGGGALAWGMTLRPEPMLAVLVTAVLVCAARFREKPAEAPLAVAAVLVGLAITAHPAGIVSTAPLLVIAPTLIRWAKTRLALATAVVTSGTALTGVLAFVGSDLELRRADARTFRIYGDSDSRWSDEVDRYATLFTSEHSIPLSGVFVGLMLIAVLARLLRRRHTDRTLLDLPGAALGVALILLIATPSKWTSHFGALLGIGAVALAAETARLRLDIGHYRAARALPVIVIGAASVAAVASWWPRTPWNALDLRSIEWTFGFETSAFSLAHLAGLVPFGLLVLSSALVLVRERDRLPRVPGRVAIWTAPALLAPAIAFTAGMLIVDSARTSTWTVARQNLDTFAGSVDCGLADEARIALPNSARRLSLTETTDSEQGSTRLTAPTQEDLNRFSLQPTSTEPIESPWFDLPDSGRFGIFVEGTPSSDPLRLEWGRRRDSQVEILADGQTSADLQSEVNPDIVTWRFLAAGDLPSPPPDATEVRFVVRGESALSSTLAVSAPVTYRNERLVDRFRREGAAPLVLPNMLMYFPCVRQPRLADGIVEVPSHVVAYRSSWPIGIGTSPFDGLLDLYTFNRLSLADSPDPVKEAAVYELDWRIPGARQAAPVKVTTTS